MRDEIIAASASEQRALLQARMDQAFDEGLGGAAWAGPGASPSAIAATVERAAAPCSATALTLDRLINPKIAVARLTASTSRRR